MPSTNKTPSFGLNQWVAEDTPAMEDFNMDNEILEQAIQLQTVLFLGEVTLFADEWTQANQVYRQDINLSVEDGYLVDLACDSSRLPVIESPIVAVNDNGTIYVETGAPPAMDIVVQVMAVHIEEVAE